MGWDGVSVGGRVEGGVVEDDGPESDPDYDGPGGEATEDDGSEGNLQKDRRDRLPQSPQNLWSPHNLCHLGESPKKGVKAFLFLFYYHQHHDCHCSAHKTPHHHLDSLGKSVLFIMLTSSRKPIPYFLLREEVVIQEAVYSLAICPAHHVQPIPHELVESGCYSLIPGHQEPSSKRMKRGKRNCWSLAAEIYPPGARAQSVHSNPPCTKAL